MLLITAGAYAGDLKKTTVPFPDYGFSADFASPFSRQMLPSSEDTPFFGAISASNGVYLVMVKKLPANTIASTFIEQSIQSDIKSAAIGSTKRWELDSRQGVFVKGLTRPLVDDIASLDPVKKFLNGKNGIQSFAMMPLEDDRSPVLMIGIVAPVESQRDAENEIRGLATFMKFTRLASASGNIPPSPATSPGPAGAPSSRLPIMLAPGPKVTPTRPVTPTPGTTTPASAGAPKPNTAVTAQPIITQSGNKPKPTKPVATAPAPKPNVVTPSPKPAAAKPSVAKPNPVATSRPEVAVKLKAGDIEIMGTVESISADKKSIQVNADRIRMPGQNVIEITPRSKKIQIKSLPENLKIGSVVSVTGKNKGIGTVLIADHLSVK